MMLDYFIWSDYALITISFFTSLITAVMGVGGGVMLMVFMLLFYPPLTVIPIHAVVQLGSNASRTFILRQFVNWTFLLPFVIGAVIGSICGSQFVFNIPQDILRIAVGVIALILTWLPKLKGNINIPFKIPILGWLSSFLGMFGAGGGMVFGVALSRMNLPRQQTIATHASCMCTLHVIKIIIFAYFGFAFAQYIPLMMAMILSGFIGTLFGTRILHKIDNKAFHLMLKAMISILCIKLILFP